MPSNVHFPNPGIQPHLLPFYAITAAKYDKPFVPQDQKPATVSEPYLIARDWEINVGSIGDLGDVTVAQTNQVGVPFELILMVSISLPTGYNFDPYAYNPASGPSRSPSIPPVNGTPNPNAPPGGVVQIIPGPSYQVTLQTPSANHTKWWPHSSLYRFTVPAGGSLTLPVCIAAAADLATFRAYEQWGPSHPYMISLALYPANALISITPPFQFSGKPLNLRLSEYEYNADQGQRQYILL